MDDGTQSLKPSDTINNAHQDYCLRIAKNPKWNIVATGGSLEDRLLKIWSMDSKKCLAQAQTAGEVNGVKWIDEDHILVGISFVKADLEIATTPILSNGANKPASRFEIYRFVKDYED